MSKRICPLINSYMFCACVVCIAAFSFWYLKIQEPIGDDVFGNYTMGISYYLDEVPDSLGERITTIGQALDTVKLIYMKWSGRVLGYVFLELNGVLSNTAKALFGTFTFVSNVLLLMAIAYGSFKEASKHALVFGVVYLALYWYRLSCFFEYMWTMIGVYEIPLMVSLVFIYFMLKAQHKGHKEFVVALILGFLAGVSNEICAVMTISILGVVWLKKVIYKEIELSSITYYLGLFAGATICIFAPGNFNRAKQSHDATLQTLTLVERMANSISNHKSVLIPVESKLKAAMIIILVFTAAFVIRYIVKNGTAGVKNLWAEVYPFVISSLISVLVWGVMPGTPSYGLSFWMAGVYIIIIRLAYCSEDESIRVQIMSIQTALGILITTWFASRNYQWLKDYETIRCQRINLINEATQSGLREVVVPRYPETVYENLVVLDYLNGKSIYETEAYVDYWGLHVKIE